MVLHVRPVLARITAKNLDVLFGKHILKLQTKYVLSEGNI